MRTRIRELRRERRALPRPSSPRAVGTHATDHHLHRGREVTPPRCRSPTRSPRYFGLTIEGRLLTFSEIDEGAVIAMKKTAESLRADISRPSAPRGHLPCRHRCRHRRHSRPGRCRHPFRRGKQLRPRALPRGFLVGLLAFAAAYTARQIRKLRRALTDDARAARASSPKRTTSSRRTSRARWPETFVHLIPPLSARHRGRDPRSWAGRPCSPPWGTLLTLCTALLVVKFRLQAPPHGARGGVKVQPTARSLPWRTSPPRSARSPRTPTPSAGSDPRHAPVEKSVRLAPAARQAASAPRRSVVDAASGSGSSSRRETSPPRGSRRRPRAAPRSRPSAGRHTNIRSRYCVRSPFGVDRLVVLSRPRARGRWGTTSTPVSSATSRITVSAGSSPGSLMP